MLVLVAFVLLGLGTIEDDNIPISLLLVGLALVVIGVGMWLVLVRPWEDFDDLQKPLFTGDEDVQPTSPVAADSALAEPEAKTAEPEAAEVVIGTEEAKEEVVVEPPAEEPGHEPAPPAVPEPPEVVVGAEEAGEPAAEAAPEPEPEPEPVPAAAAPEPAPQPPAPEPDDLTVIEGLGPKTQEALYAAGITTFSQIATMTPDELVETARAHGARINKADTWPEQARKAAGGQVAELDDLQDRIEGGTVHEKLTEIEGIGPKTQEALYAARITTFQQVADATPDDLRAILDEAGLSLLVPDTWPEQAALLAKGDLSGFEALKDELKGGRRV